MGNLITDFFKGKQGHGRRADDHVDRRAPRTEPVTGLPTGGQSLESPYVYARREWNERYGSYIARTRTWQYVALGSLALSAVLGLALVRVASQAKVQPFVVEVDKLGAAVAIRPADAAYTPDQRIIRFQLANFITNARSVTPDPVVQKRWLDSVYAVASTSSAAFLNDFYKKSDPFNVARTSMVAVDIQTALPLSKDTWQIQWTETKRGLNGQTDSITRWQAVLNISIFTPTTPQQIVANPTGVVIDQINWTQQL
jgi:type IV secretory pathway TrbF-like protein